MADGLLGKLRALQRQLSATVDNCDGNYALMLRIHESAADELADLLRFADALIERCAVKCDVIDDQYDNGAGYPAQRCANALRAMKVSAP